MAQESNTQAKGVPTPTVKTNEKGLTPLEHSAESAVVVAAAVVAALTKVLGSPEKKQGVSPWLASILVASIAAAAPLTAAIVGHFKAIEEREMAKAEQRRLEIQQEHEIRSFYFERAVDPASTPELRERVLRYLADDDNVRLRDWAVFELTEVSELLKEMEEKEAERQRELEAKQTELEAVIKESTESKEAQVRAERKVASLREDIRGLQKPVENPSSSASTLMPSTEPGKLECLPGSIAMEFHPERGADCGQPTARAYKDSVSGLIWWSVGGGSCFCRPR